MICAGGREAADPRVEFPGGETRAGLRADSGRGGAARAGAPADGGRWAGAGSSGIPDRKSTRLNSSHLVISYAVFCLKKKKKTYTTGPRLERHQPAGRS